MTDSQATDPAQVRRRSGSYLSPAKITPPVSSPHEVKRQTLLDRVLEDASGHVIVIQAPAGFGKTTLMSQLQRYFRDHGQTTGWLTLDEADNDVSRFMAGFAAAVEGMSDNSTDRLERPSSNHELSFWIFDRLATIQPPPVMFFDDLESIRNPVVMGLLNRGINSLPANASVVIGSRNLPDIGLPRLRALGRLIELDAAELRFTQDESGEFLRARRGFALGDEQVAQLQFKTEGWAAALWLASLALARRQDTGAFIDSFSGTNAAVAAYLAEDVLDALPAEQQDFLLRCSVLKELSEPLCNAVCGCDNSLDRLRELDRLNIFLNPIDETRSTFKFHSLFRDFLLNRLTRLPKEELAKLHRVAANAYLADGRPVPAITHALEADPDGFGIPLLREHLDDLLVQGRMRLLAGWIARLPAATRSTHPWLLPILAWSVTFTRGPRAGLELIKDLDETTLPPSSLALLQALRPMLLAMMDRISEAHALGLSALETVDESHSFARAMIYQALTQTSIILGEHENAHEYVDQARRAQREATTGLGHLLAEAAEAVLDLMSGRLKNARTRIDLARTRFKQARQSDHDGNPLAGTQYAEILYEQGETVEAKRLLEVYAPLMRDLGPPDALISSHIMLARIAARQGDDERAYELLTELETAGHHLNAPRVLASARLERARMSLVCNDLNTAKDHLTTAENTYDWNATKDHWYVANDTLTPRLIRATWLIRSGAAAKALPILQNELNEAMQTNRPRRALKIRILLAEAYAADRQRNKAMRALRRALEFADAEGFTQTFADEGSAITALVQEFRAGEHQQEPVDQITYLRPEKPVMSRPAMADMGIEDPLTPKEVEVLELLAQGCSNTELSERLFVSESTVRTHLRSINLKLHAGNRTQAVAIARTLGLVA